MNKNLTELVFILDRSGSMSGLEADTIGGFNGLIQKQKAQEGEALISTVLFDDRIETLHDRIPLTKIQPMTEKQYFVRGCTALIDAIGCSIDHIDTIHKYIREEDRPAHTMFIITTDGMENASRRYQLPQVRSMIEAHKEKGWEFLFLGANIDAIQTAGNFGIAPERAVNYCNDTAGTALNYEAMELAISDFRACRPVSANWKAKVEADHAARSSNNEDTVVLPRIQSSPAPVSSTPPSNSKTGGLKKAFANILHKA